MASKRRANQVGDTIWRELATLIKRSIADPRLQTVTITGVDVSSDLRHARVFVAMRDTENKDEMMKGLEKAGPFLRHLLSKATALRIVPVLHFYFDDSIDKGMHLSQLLNRLDVEAPSEPEEDNDGSEEESKSA